MAHEAKVSLGGGQSASFDGDTLIIKGKQGASIDLDSQAYDNLLQFNAAHELADRQNINDDTQAFWNTTVKPQPDPELVIREGGVGNAEFAVLGTGDIDALNHFIAVTNPDFLL